jgi:hypothetical protein
MNDNQIDWKLVAGCFFVMAIIGSMLCGLYFFTAP